MKNADVNVDPGDHPLPAAARSAHDDAALLQECFRDEQLPRFVPGEPRGFASRRAAEHAAQRALQVLGRAHGFSVWNVARFRSVLLPALAAWRRGAELRDEGLRLRFRSTHCPVGGEAWLDPRVCDMCQAFTEALARRAYNEDFRELFYEQLMSQGAGSCVFTLLRGGPGESGR